MGTFVSVAVCPLPRFWVRLVLTSLYFLTETLVLEKGFDPLIADSSIFFSFFASKFLPEFLSWVRLVLRLGDRTEQPRKKALCTGEQLRANLFPREATVGYLMV